MPDLSCAPVDSDALPDCVRLFSNVHRAALGALIAAAEDGTDCAALTGEAGTGKTAVLDTTAALLGHPPVQVIRVRGGDAPLTSKRLIAQIIGCEADNKEEEAIEQALVRLLAPASPWTRTILMIDDAHALERDALAYLQLTCGLQAPDVASLQILFVGRPEFWSLLEPEHLRSLRERIRFRPVLPRAAPPLLLDPPDPASDVPAVLPGRTLLTLPQHGALREVSVPARRRRPRTRYAAAVSGIAATVVITSIGPLTRDPPTAEMPMITAGYAAPMRAAVAARSVPLPRPVVTESVVPTPIHAISAAPAIAIQVVAAAAPQPDAMGTPPAATTPVANWVYRRVPVAGATAGPPTAMTPEPPTASAPPAPQADATGGPPAVAKSEPPTASAPPAPQADATGSPPAATTPAPPTTASAPPAAQADATGSPPAATTPAPPTASAPPAPQADATGSPPAAATPAPPTTASAPPAPQADATDSPPAAATPAPPTTASAPPPAQADATDGPPVATRPAPPTTASAPPAPQADATGSPPAATTPAPPTTASAPPAAQADATGSPPAATTPAPPTTASAPPAPQADATGSPPAATTPAPPTTAGAPPAAQADATGSLPAATTPEPPTTASAPPAGAAVSPEAGRPPPAADAAATRQPVAHTAPSPATRNAASPPTDAGPGGPNSAAAMPAHTVAPGATVGAALAGGAAMTGGASPPPPSAKVADLTPPSTPAATAMPSPAPVRQPTAVLPPAMVASLLRHGDEMLRIGDIAAARLLFGRAAAAGSAAAAIAIGKTNDPRFLAETGAQGIVPDPVVAADWYRRAAALGDRDADRLLDGLGASAAR